MATPTNPIERLDVPQTAVEAEAERLWAERDRRVAALHARLQQERDAAVLREAIEREAELHDDYEVSALAGSLYLVTHPKVPVSTDDDYPEWAAALAARIENEQQQRRTT